MPQTPNQQRAADAVAAWLARHHRNPAWLVDAAKADPGTINDFLGQQRWPKLGTQGRIENALGWPAGVIRQIGNGADVLDDLLETEPAATVGGDPQDPGYVTAPGERIEAGVGDDEVLANIRAMREDMRAMREAIERLADRDQPGT